VASEQLVSESAKLLLLPTAVHCSSLYLDNCCFTRQTSQAVLHVEQISLGATEEIVKRIQESQVYSSLCSVKAEISNLFIGTSAFNENMRKHV
jgi:hypothetical protein